VVIRVNFIEEKRSLESVVPERVIYVVDLGKSRKVVEWKTRQRYGQKVSSIFTFERYRCIK